MKEAVARRDHRERHRSTNQESVHTEARGREICAGALNQKAMRTASWIAIQTWVVWSVSCISVMARKFGKCCDDSTFGGTTHRLRR